MYPDAKGQAEKASARSAKGSRVDTMVVGEYGYLRMSGNWPHSESFYIQHVDQTGAGFEHLHCNVKLVSKPPR
jgi:hypothetical protein